MSGIRGACAIVLAMACVAGCSSGDDSAPGNTPSGTAAVGVVAPPPGGGGTTPTTPATPGGGSGGAIVPNPGTGGTSGAVAGGAGGAGGTTPPAGGAGGTTVTPPSGGASWTMMGGDARNNYYNPNEKTLGVDNAANLQELWTFTVAGYPPGSPVIVDGVVYVMATGGTYAIGLADGKMIWARTDLVGTASVAYDNGFIYVHASPATLYKLKASDGTTVWGPTKTYDHPNADGTSSPIVSGGKVIVGHSCGTAEIGFDANALASSHGGVFAADVETGMQAWHYWTTGSADTPENGAMVWSTVSVADGVVYAGAGNNYTMAGMHSDAIHAIDLATGMAKWVKQVRTGDTWALTNAQGEDTDFGANPIIADFNGKKIVADGDKGSAFWALDRDTGNVLWSRNDLSGSHFAANGGVLMNGAFDGQFFYVISNDPTPVASILHKLKAEDGTDAMPPITYPKITWGAPSLANGLLVVPVDNELVILNAATMAELKRFDTGGTIAAGAAAIVDGKIVVKSGLQYPLGTVTDNNQIRCYGLK